MDNLDPLIVFKFGAFINDQCFQLGEASHGFLGGQMHQVLAMHNVQMLKSRKIAQSIEFGPGETHTILVPFNFKKEGWEC